MAAEKLRALRVFVAEAFTDRSNALFLGLSICRVWVYVFFLAVGTRMFVPLGETASVNLGNALFFGFGALLAFASAVLETWLAPRFGRLAFAGVLVFGLAAASLLVLSRVTDVLAFAALALVCAGLVLALLRVAWGCAYGCLESRLAGLYTALSFLLAVIAVVVLKLLPRGVSVASLFVLPLVAAFLLKRVYGQPICMDAVTGDFREPGTMRAFAPLAVSMFVFVAASAALRSLLEGHAASEWLLHWQTTFVDAVVAFLFFVIYLVFKRMDPMPVYRCVIPLIVVGYMVFPLLPGEQRVIGAMFAATGYGLFDLLSWVVMARFVHDGRGKPLQVFGIGVGVTLAGRSFGCVAADMCLGLQAQGMLDLSTVSLVMMFVLVLVCFLVLPERALIHVSAEASAGASAGSDQLRAACMRLADEKGLTPRETDVLLPLSRGRNAQAIARELQIASGTAQTHIKHIYTKTGVHNQQELIDLLEHMGA